MADRPTTTVPASKLRKLIEDLLRATGCSENNLNAASEVFIEAELRGVGVQGIDYLPYMIQNIRKGNLDTQAEPHVVKETAATALIDGRHGLGQPAAIMAVDCATRKASEAGVAAVGVMDAPDIYMLGYYTDRIAREGYVGMAFTSGAPLVHPYGGIDRILSTNPLSISFPTGSEHPMVFDASTSALSAARIRHAAYHGEQVPPNSGIGADGYPTTDAAAIQKGAISPMAGHKGYGLSLCVALFSGPLTGSDIGRSLLGFYGEGPAGRPGHFFIAINPSAFGDTGAFRSAVDAYITEIKSSRKAPGVSEIHIPGERKGTERSRRLKDGIPVLDATLKIIKNLADELGVNMEISV